MNYREQAKCDFHYRKGNIIRACEYATLARKLAKNMHDHRQYAENRILVLNNDNNHISIEDTVQNNPLLMEIIEEGALEARKHDAGPVQNVCALRFAIVLLLFLSLFIRCVCMTLCLEHITWYF